MIHNVVVPISPDPPLPPRQSRRDRHRAIVALVLGALPVFAVGLLVGGLIELLVGGLIESTSARSMLLAVTVVSCTGAFSLSLGLYGSRLHADTRAELRQLRELTVEQAREAGYAVGYVDGRLGRAPRDGGTGPVQLRPVR